MKRREFIELSATAAAAIIAGNMLFPGRSSIENVNRSKCSTGPRFRMSGGCGDYRMMSDLPPEQFEREILGNWA